MNSLPEPKRLVIFPDSDHFFVGREREVGQQAVKLLQQFSSPPPDDSLLANSPQSLHSPGMDARRQESAQSLPPDSGQSS